MDAAPTCASTATYEWEVDGPQGLFGASAAVAMDRSGNTYLAARYRGVPNLGPGPLAPSGINDNVAIAKIDPSGGVVWSTSIRSTNLDFQGGIATDSEGDVYVSGGTYGAPLHIGSTMNAITFSPGTNVGNNMTLASGFVAKLDGDDGSFVWGRPVDSVGDTRYGVTCGALAVEGSRVVVGCDFVSAGARIAGVEVSNADTTGKTSDVLVAVLDRAGVLSYARRLGGNIQAPLLYTGDDRLGDVAIAPSGNVVVLATVFSQGPELVGPNNSPASPLVRIGNMDAKNAELAWIDASGNLAHAQAFGNSSLMPDQEAIAARVAIDPVSGDVYATGRFRGTIEYGGGAKGDAAPGPAGNICGYTTKNCADAFVVRIDRTTFGAVWHKEIGGSQDEEVDSLAADACGITLGGRNRSGNLTIDGKNVAGWPDPFITPDAWTSWLARFAADGTIHWAKGLASSLRISAYDIATIGDRTRITVGVASTVALDGVKVFKNPNSSGPYDDGLVIWGLMP